MIPPILLVGCGRMGQALLAGWHDQGLAPSYAVDPSMPQVQGATVVAAAEDLPADFAPAAVVLAVKPQSAPQALPSTRRFPAAVALSIMAGRSLAWLQPALDGLPVVRAMPNTPAAIRQGITVACAGAGVTAEQRQLCDTLLRAVGQVEWVTDEALIDPVTAVSGSGPAYVFLLAELLERAAIEQGLPADLARALARQTVAGAGALLLAGDEDAAQLRRNVTSPNGTTEAALTVLMRAEAWPAALSAAVAAATRRSRELAG